VSETRGWEGRASRTNLVRGATTRTTLFFISHLILSLPTRPAGHGYDVRDVVVSSDNAR
jgi:hypothetical protein